MTVHISTVPSLRARPLLVSLATTALLAFGITPAGATINNGNEADLTLTIWDPIGQVSYTKDLGINVLDFFNYAQSDNGYQHFWHINGSTDAALQQLLNIGTATSSLYWALTAVDVDGIGDPGDQSLYTTLRQGTTAGVINPDYAQLTGLTAGTAQSALLQYGVNYIVAVNNAPTAAYNTQGTSFETNGSTFSRKGQNGYFDTYFSWEIAQGTFNDVPGHGIINKVGNSSWFYKLTSASYDASEAVAVDEFDNLSHDGYWGLAVDPANGDYVLSYTLQGATINALALTANGLLRIGLTEYRASIGTPTLVTTATREFAGWMPMSMSTVSAVPEPSTWIMSLAGLAAVGVAARKRRG